MIIALAGRRIDASDAQERRFPLDQVPVVRQRLQELFVRRNASGLVCSGACGADLLALDVAGQLGLHRRMVLPYLREQFRKESVTDRPGDWGPLFDRIADAVAPDDLVVLQDAGEGEAAYAAVNTVILEEAAKLAQNQHRATAEDVLAVLIWEGTPRPGNDLTAAFAEVARAKHYDIEQILTR